MHNNNLQYTNVVFTGTIWWWHSINTNKSDINGCIEYNVNEVRVRRTLSRFAYSLLSIEQRNAVLFMIFEMLWRNLFFFECTFSSFHFFQHKSICQNKKKHGTIFWCVWELLSLYVVLYSLMVHFFFFSLLHSQYFWEIP